MILLFGIWVFSFFVMLGGVAEGAVIFFIGLIALFAIAVHNERVDNYDISKIDVNKMRKDAGKSKIEVQKNMINGKYDK